MENIAFQTDWLYGLIGGLFIGLGGAVFLLGTVASWGPAA